MSKKLLVVGCGGIGGVIAARLTRAGHDVTAITGNPLIAESIRKDGYVVREFDGTSWSQAASHPPLVTPAEAPTGARYDACFVATKATTLEAAVRSALPLLAPDAPIVTCQNGLPEELAARVAGPRRVLGCVVVWAASMEAPGQYVRTSKGRFELGRASEAAADPALVQGVLEAVAPVKLVDDLRGVRWAKLAINCATSTLGAVSGQRLGYMLRRSFVRRMVLELWSEIAAVAAAEGVKMAPVTGLDIAKLALRPSERNLAVGSPRLAFKHAILLAVGVKYRRLRSSMLIALERGRLPEIDFLNGEIVTRAAHHGIEVPWNARLVDTVWRLHGKELAPSMDLLRSLYDEPPPARNPFA